jgi:excisionase family DNA binding protein
MRVRFVRAGQLSSPEETQGPVQEVSPQLCHTATMPTPSDATIPAAPPEPPFLSFREAAEWLCVSLSTLKRMVSRGEFMTVHVGKHRKIPANYLASYVAKDVLLPNDIYQTETSASSLEYQ